MDCARIRDEALRDAREARDHYKHTGDPLWLTLAQTHLSYARTFHRHWLRTRLPRLRVTRINLGRPHEQARKERS
jgi:hypothetical protein